MSDLPITPVEPKKKFNSKIWVPIIIIIILIVGYTVLASQMNWWPLGNNPVAISVSPTPIQTLSPSATPSSTSDWKTYTDTKYGFQIKYPSTWEVLADSVSNNQFDFHVQDKQVGGYEPPRLQISSIKDTRNNAPQPIESKTFPESNTNSNGENYIFFNLDGKTVYANCLYPSNYQNLISFCNQILSTLKFTNSTLNSNSINDGIITYQKNDSLFTLTKKDFLVTSEFSTQYLVDSSRGCGTNHNTTYYNNLLTKASGVKGTKYDFTFKGQSQDSGVYEITVIPNKFGYKSISDFKNDFDYCDGGGTFYPSSLNSSYLMFEPACGTGYDDGSGRPHGCSEIQLFFMNNTPSKLTKLFLTGGSL